MPKNHHFPLPYEALLNNENGKDKQTLAILLYTLFPIL